MKRTQENEYPMRIFAVDDEPEALAALREAIRTAAPCAEIRAYPGGQEALDAVTRQGLFPDIVFTDIRMPGMDGFQLADALKRAAPGARTVLVTACPDYALEAWKHHVRGFIVKPAAAADIRETLEDLDPMPAPAQREKLQVRCFGHFEVFRNGEPVVFVRKQSKELLAFLIDREGAACSNEQIAAALWENESDLRAAGNRIRKLISDLKATLAKIGMEDVLIRERRQLAVRRSRIDCDYYRLLEGDVKAADTYREAYMPEYSWAEVTAGRLDFRREE